MEIRSICSFLTSVLDEEVVKYLNSNTIFHCIIELYHRWTIVYKIILDLFSILVDQYQLRTQLNFQKELQQVWTRNFADILIQKHNLLNCIIKEIQLMKETTSYESIKIITEVLQLFYDHINRSQYVHLTSNLIDYFEKQAYEFKQKAIASECYPIEIQLYLQREQILLQMLYDKYRNNLIKKEMTLFVTNEYERIFVYLKDIFDLGNFHNILITIELILSNTPSIEILDGLKSICMNGCTSLLTTLLNELNTFDISAISTIIQQFEVFKTFDIIESSILIGMKTGFTQSDIMKKKGNEIFILLCQYVNQYIDKNEMNKLMDVIRILTLVSNKELFESLYWKSLYFKIVNGKLNTIDNEQQFVTLLKSNIDPSFSKRIEKLLTDHIISHQLTTSYTKQNTTLLFKFNCSVFALFDHCEDLLIPHTLSSNLLSVFNGFKESYIHSNPNRILTLIPSHSTCLLTLKFNDKKVLIQCTTLQYLILQCFTINEICSLEYLATYISSYAHLLKTCDQLVEYGILHKCDDKYTFNERINMNQTLINITKSIKQTTKDKLKEVQSDVEEKQQNQLTCAIVRIMKQQKIKKIVHLVNEVVFTVSSTFTPQVVDVKKSIEYLIQKGYLKRSDNDSSSIEFIS